MGIYSVHILYVLLDTITNITLITHSEAAILDVMDMDVIACHATTCGMLFMLQVLHASCLQDKYEKRGHTCRTSIIELPY
jgi:hypothetical protein